MAKRDSVKRPPGELAGLLREQLIMLRDSCQKFDSGEEFYAKPIALQLRILLHHQGQSRSLLEQMGLRNVRFLDTAGAINPRNLLTSSNLIGIRHDNQGNVTYMPLFDGVGLSKQIPFPHWWGEPVIKDNNGRLMNRRQLILSVADQDGGAHIDAELDSMFHAFSRGNSLGWLIGDGERLRQMEGRPDLASIRQIAHEVVSTLRKKVPQYF